MVIIVNGQTGVENAEVVKKLKAKILARKGINKSTDEQIIRHVVRDYDVEEIIMSLTKASNLNPYLDSLNETLRESVWIDAVHHIQESIKLAQKEDPEVICIISLHFAYFRDHHFRSSLFPNELELCDPKVILTLVDDCYDIAERVNVIRERKMKTRSNLSISTILSWRSVEEMLARVFSRGLKGNCEHFIVSIKHSAKVTERLVSDADCLRCYSAYPITKTRQDDQFKNELQEFLARLENDFIVFDPATIDEFRGFKRGTGRLPVRDPMVGATRDYYDDYFDELVDSKIAIKDQISTRDYRFIDQSDVVVMFRPYYGGRASGGVTSEALNALYTNTTVYIYSPQKETEDAPSSVFKSIEQGIGFDNTEELFATLKLLQQKKRKPNIEGSQ